ncbi:MAG: hypothetical protein WA160_16155 [Pseudobdellovibrio sp.]
MKKQMPTPPTIQPELAATFLKTAAEFYKLSPWESFHDSEVIGVLIPETKELHFSSIMGGAGQCFGFATNRGFKGLLFIRDLLDGFAEDDPFEARLKQDGLLLEFTQKKYLDEFDLSLAQQSNFKPASSKAWVFTRDLSPGYVPWFILEKDILALNRIMSAITALIEMVDKDPNCLLHDTEKRTPMLIWKNKSSSWQLEFWTDKKIRLNDKSSNLEEYFLPNSDELSLRRLKNLKIDKNQTWLVHDFHSREPVLEKDRPFYPRICSVLDNTNDLCLGMDLISPEKIAGLALRDLVLKSISEQKTIPAKIVVSKSEQLLGLIALEKSLGIEVGFGDMDQATEFEAAFREKMENGNQFMK